MVGQNRQGEGKNIMVMEKPKNLYVQPMDMNLRQGNAGGRQGTGQEGIKGRKIWDNCNSIINKIYLE